jgi:hypothetical protein
MAAEEAATVDSAAAGTLEVAAIPAEVIRAVEEVATAGTIEPQGS